MYQQTLYKIIDDHINPKVIKRLNKSKKWKYGYNKEYDVVVISKDQDIIECTARIAKFYKHESCGQCTPCREGCGWMWRMLNRMSKGEATYKDIDLAIARPAPRRYVRNNFGIIYIYIYIYIRDPGSIILYRLLLALAS